MLIAGEQIQQAARAIHQWLEPTPLIRSDYLSNRLGCNVWLKLEMLQPTHSFKVRGAFSAMSRLTQQQRSAGVVTASGGNHGLAVAYAAHKLDIPAIILLPRKTSEERIDAIRFFNADVRLHGESWDDANVEARRIERNAGSLYIHPFDDMHVMAGQGTIVSELVQQIERIDLLVASIGGGGLLSGLISAVHAWSPQTRVIGVETEGADSMHQSWRAGRIVELEAITSIAETLGARSTQPRQFAIITGHAASLVTVSDEQAIRALLDILDAEKLLTEPATSCSVAALLTGKIPVDPSENVVIVLCGANVGLKRVIDWQRRAS